MSKVKGCKNGIRKNELYGVKVAFEQIEKQCQREKLPLPNINGGSRTRFIQDRYKIAYTYWNGVSHKGAVYKYKGEDLLKFIELFMNDWRTKFKNVPVQPKQASIFELPEITDELTDESPFDDSGFPVAVVTIYDKFVADELTRRADYEKIPRNVYLRGILVQYFEEHPFDWSDLEHKTEGLQTREDWLNFIRENYETKGEE